MKKADANIIQSSGKVPKDLMPFNRELIRNKISVWDLVKNGNELILMFNSGNDVREFLNIVAIYEEDKDSLYWSVVGSKGDKDWVYEVVFFNWGDELENEGADYLSEFFCVIYVTIPIMHLNGIMQRLVAHNN